MAIEVPEGVQGLFLVLTGERWPTANEDALREVGNAWGTAGDRLENELGPYMVQVVAHIRENFTGKSAIRFADMMGPYVVDSPRYVPQAAEQFQQLKKFLLDASAQVEYVKIISIEELILLIAQIAWAIAMAFWTDGASMTWLAGRFAIVEFLLKTWWGRLILQFVLAELFGIGFQLALDVLTQAIQFAKHTRTEWDVKATISAVEVGAVGGALSLPFSAISHLVATRLTRVLSRALSRDINISVLQPVVVRAVNGAARNADNAPISEVAKNITDGLFKAADKPLRIRLTEIGVPALIEMTEEGLHEAITEGVVMAANGQGFQFNPYSFTSGAAGSLAGKAGHGIGTKLAVPKPVREGYTELPGDDGERSADAGDAPLSSEVAGGATTVRAADLDRLTPADVPGAGRLVVLDHGADGPVTPSAAGQAARRLGVDVVARVDRALIGDGRRDGHDWMVFQANGGRPRPVTSYGPPAVTAIQTAARTGTPTATPHADMTAGSRDIRELGRSSAVRPDERGIASAGRAVRLPAETVRRDYPWLTRINPLYGKGGDFATNCMLAAIYTDRTLEERSGPGGEPVHYQVSPSGVSPDEHLRAYRDRAPVPVRDYASIVAAMTQAGPGARGLVVVGTAGSDIDHVFNVVHDRNGVVFLDGQRGTQADPPRRPVRLEFLPTSDEVPVHVVPVEGAVATPGLTRSLGRPSAATEEITTVPRPEEVTAPVRAEASLTTETQAPAGPPPAERVRWGDEKPGGALTRVHRYPADDGHDVPPHNEAGPSGTAPRHPLEAVPTPPEPQAAEREDPRAPWYAAHGGFGDGTVASVPGRVNAAVRRWSAMVTADLRPSVAATIRRRIHDLLQEDDPKVWEKLLRHGKLITVGGVRVKLTFQAERLAYEPPAEQAADPGYQTYFSKYGDTSYSEGESEHVHRAATGRIEPLLFLAAAAQGALSHVSPSVKISAESGQSSGRSIAMEVQSGNRVIANATHLHRGRIRVRATVDRVPRPDHLLPGTARLSFPTVYSSAAETLPVHPAVRVVDPTVLHELDHAVNAVIPGRLLTGLAYALEGLGLPEAAVDEIQQEVAEEYFNEKALKDRSQWWLTDSWVSNLVTEKVSRWLPDFRGHVEVSGAPHTVRYVTTTDDEVLIRNDIADTALIRDGGEHSRGASLTPGVALGFEIGDHLATPSFDLPMVKSTREHGRTVATEGQAKNAIMRKDRLVRYRTEFLMTVRIRSNKGDTSYTEPVVGELAIGREHARDFERHALGGKPTGSGLVAAEEFAVPADRAAPAPALPPRRRPGFAAWLRSRFAGGTPAPFPAAGVGGPGGLLALADRGPLEIVVPRALHNGVVPDRLFASEAWQPLLERDNVTWLLLDANADESSIFLAHTDRPGDAPWRYVLDTTAHVVGAVLMERRADGVREARGYVPNPRAPLPPAETDVQHWHEPLQRPLRDAGLDAIADFLDEGGLPQIQLTEASRHRLDAAGEDPLSRAIAALGAHPRIPILTADGSPLRTGQEPGRPPEKRFVIDGGDVRGPLRPWYHVVHPREPIALAARTGLGRGVVRETPGLQDVYREVQDSLAHQMRVAGVAGGLSANDRQHLARVLAMKFGVPGLRGAYPALIDGGVSHEVRAGDHIFTVALDAELRALRRDPVAERGVTLDLQHKGVAALSTTEKKGVELGGGFDVRFRAKLSRLFSLDLNVLKMDAKRAWQHKIIDSTGVKEYRREKTSGPVTRFEYETVYRLTVTTRGPAGGVTAAQVRELSGDRYWTAVTVSDAHLPKTPVPAEKILAFGEVTVARGPLDDAGVRRLAARPGRENAPELDLNAKGLTGVRVGLAATSAVSEQLAAMVAEHHGRSWVGTKADAFQQVLAKIVPSGRRYGVAERILRSGTQTFLEAQTRTLLSKRGLPIPLPPTPDGWRQELRIRLRAFNPAHENTVEGATLEQYSEADLRFGEEDSVVDGADAAGGLGGVFRIGGSPAAEGERTTSQKSASQVSGGVTVGGGLSRGRHTGDLGGSLDLNLGTYAGDSEQAGADAVYTIEYRRRRHKRRPRFGRVSYTTTRHVRVERGLEILAPYVRAADLGLPEPADRPRRDLPVKDGERYHLDRDLAMAVAHVEHVGADSILDAIEEILGETTDPEVLNAVQSAFSEEAIRAQFGIARKGGIQQVVKTPARLWRDRSFWDFLKIPAQLNGTVHTGIRVTVVDETVDHRRPRPDVRVTSGGQGFVQTGKSSSRDRSGRVSAFLHGRWASAPKGYRPAGGVNIEYERSVATKLGTNTTARDIRRATAADSSQEFTHDVRFRVEVFRSYSPSELGRHTWQVLKAGPKLVEVLSRGESRRLWHRWFPPGKAAPVTREVPGRATVLVPTHLTTQTRPDVIPAKPGWAAVSRLPVPAPSPLAEAFAEHGQALSMPGAETLPSWAPAAAVPWRRIDHRAAAHGVAPVVAEFAPGTQDGLTLAIALSERNLRANIAPLLAGTYRIPLMDKTHLTVQLVPTRARWLTRGEYTALNFPEHAEEPERETEESRGWSGGFEFDLGHPVGHPLAEGAERPLLDPGASYDGGTKRVRVKANSTGDYVESNRQRDGGYDYYLFDATWLITGEHGHTVNIPIPNGFTGMLPAAVVRRLIAEFPDLNLEAPPPSGG
jgi:hypothetical protein